MTKLNGLFGCLLLAVSVLAGCDSGPKLTQVTGVVTLDGEPTEGLEVLFEPIKPKGGEATATAMGVTGPGGRYELAYPGDNRRGAPVGEYRVRITASERDDVSTLPTVAEKYNSNTELTAKVESGANTINFDVTSR